MVGGAQQNRVTPSPFNFGLWTWTWIVTIMTSDLDLDLDCDSFNSMSRSDCARSMSEGITLTRLLIMHVKGCCWTHDN